MLCTIEHAKRKSQILQGVDIQIGDEVNLWVYRTVDAPEVALPCYLVAYCIGGANEILYDLAFPIEGGDGLCTVVRGIGGKVLPRNETPEGKLKEIADKITPAAPRQGLKLASVNSAPVAAEPRRDWVKSSSGEDIPS